MSVSSYPRHARPWPVLVLAFVALAQAACGGANPASSADRPSTSPAVSPASSPAPVATASPTPAAAYPLTLVDDEGTEVVLDERPARIASLTPASTEILFGLGAGDRVVATDDGSDYPEAATGLPHVATFATVDTEQVVNVEADLVIAGGLGFTPADAITRLRALGIPVLVVYAASVEGVLHDIELIGQAAGVADRAAELTDSMRAEITAISEAASAHAAAAGGKARVYYEIGYTDTTGQIFAPAESSFLAEMVALAGAEPITTGDPNTYEIPLERLIELDPQVIILGVNPFYEPTPEDVAVRSGWQVMSAVRDGAVRPVQDTEITRPGPRLPTGLRALAEAIWPDIQLPPAP